jgi:hypothetical protein
VTQQPVISGDRLAIGVLVQGGRTPGGQERYPVPTPGFVQFKLDTTVADTFLEIVEGDGLRDANRRAAFRDLYYGGGGSLYVESLLPGSGPLVQQLGSTSGGGGGARVRVAPPPTIQNLLRGGFNLGENRRLVQAPYRVMALPPDRQRYLFVARFTKDRRNGEGLFTVRGDGSQVQAVAVTDLPVQTGSGEQPVYRGFGAQRAHRLEAPSVASDGTVVFEALLETNKRKEFGLFCFAPREGTPRLLERFLTSRPRRWMAGSEGKAYYLAGDEGARQLMEALPGAKRRLIFEGQTVSGDALPSASLTHLDDFVLSGAGQLFVSGALERIPGIYRVENGQSATPRLLTIAAQGQPVPPCGQAARLSGFYFRSDFVLQSASRCGSLLFGAEVGQRNDDGWRGGGDFGLGAAGCPEALYLAGWSLASKGSIGLWQWGQKPDTTCDDVVGTQALAQDPAAERVGAVAFQDGPGGLWSIYRKRGNQFTRVAREGEILADGSRLVLEAGPLLGLAAGHGPVFAVNDTGEVAFLGSDGKGWSVYRSVEPGSSPR